MNIIYLIYCQLYSITEDQCLKELNVCEAKLRSPHHLIRLLNSCIRLTFVCKRVKSVKLGYKVDIQHL